MWNDVKGYMSLSKMALFDRPYRPSLVSSICRNCLFSTIFEIGLNNRLLSLCEGTWPWTYCRLITTVASYYCYSLKLSQSVCPIRHRDSKRIVTNAYCIFKLGCRKISCITLEKQSRSFSLPMPKDRASRRNYLQRSLKVINNVHFITIELKRYTNDNGNKQQRAEGQRWN